MIMNWKRKVAALVMAAMLTGGLSSAASADYYGSYSYPAQAVNESIGDSADLLLLTERIIAYRDMAARCGEEYVKPYFESRGIGLTDLEAEAIAFASLEITAESEPWGTDMISYSAECAVTSTDWFDKLYGNKSYLESYRANVVQLTKLSQELAPARMSYAQYGDSESAEVLRDRQFEREDLYQTFENFWKYWHGKGASVFASKDNVFVHIGPFLESPPQALLSSDECLYPVYKDGKPCLYILGNGARWLKVICANGLVGYVQEEEIYWPCNIANGPEDYIISYVEQ